jgi:YidC/Oxa1 family membrane protein insertase
LFIDLPRRVRNPDWRLLGIEPLESSFRALAGEIISPQQLMQAPEKIEQLLNNQSEFKTRMRQLRNDMVFNLGHCTELGAVEIARLADKVANKRHLREQSGVA